MLNGRTPLAEAINSITWLALSRTDGVTAPFVDSVAVVFIGLVVWGRIRFRWCGECLRMLQRSDDAQRASD